MKCFNPCTVARIIYLISLHINKSISLTFQYQTKNHIHKNDPSSTSSSSFYASSPQINENEHKIENNKDDTYFMRRALSHASKSYGKTYPNPAVGCVILSHEKQILGEGFHPKAGMPHAEIFALFQVSGLVSDGVSAALQCLNDDTEVSLQMNELVSRYCSENGPMELFNGCCSKGCTAFVTLEPCCHYGKTPPCASALKYAGVDRVVIGYPDTNPKVNGGGVKLLQDAGIQVDFIQDASLKRDCYKMIEYFLNRISSSTIEYDSLIDCGKKRRLLRSIAGRRKNEQTLLELTVFVPSTISIMEDEELWLPSPPWLEEADGILWQDELLLLRIDASSHENKRDIVVKTGDAIARELNAYVAQKLGHTILLYRPSKTPVISLE